MGKGRDVRVSGYIYMVWPELRTPSGSWGGGLSESDLDSMPVIMELKQSQKIASIDTYISTMVIDWQLCAKQLFDA